MRRLILIVIMLFFTGCATEHQARSKLLAKPRGVLDFTVAENYQAVYRAVKAALEAERTPGPYGIAKKIDAEIYTDIEAAEIWYEWVYTLTPAMTPAINLRVRIETAGDRSEVHIAYAAGWEDLASRIREVCLSQARAAVTLE